MGRLKIGEFFEPRKPLFSRKQSPVGLLLPTRRRPYGLYSVLGLEAGAGPAEIKRAYRKLALQNHPDRVFASPQARAAATKQMQQINNAYEWLQDPERRRKYDSVAGFEEEGNINTHRSRVHRHRLSALERGFMNAANTARRRIDKRALATRRTKEPLLGRRIVKRRGTTLRSRIVPPDGEWLLLRRSRKERTCDKRKGKFLAVFR